MRSGSGVWKCACAGTAGREREGQAQDGARGGWAGGFDVWDRLREFRRQDGLLTVEQRQHRRRALRQARPCARDAAA